MANNKLCPCKLNNKAKERLKKIGNDPKKCA